MDEDTGEVVSIERNEVLLIEMLFLRLNTLKYYEAGVKTILLHKQNSESSEFEIIHNTLQKDPANSEKEAVEHIYRQLRKNRNSKRNY